MPVVGITGHMNLTKPTVALVDREIRAELSPYPPSELVGVSCIAEGADSIFAQAILDLGGRLEVVLPAADYRERKVKARHQAKFDELVRRAETVTVMPHGESTRAAYETANDFVQTRCDCMVAVWDGQATQERSGTADVVASAIERGIPVKIIWPLGAERS